MNIILAGEVFSDNLGDQIVYLTTKRLVKYYFPDANILPLDIMGRKNRPNNIVIEEKNIYESKPSDDIISCFRNNVIFKRIFDLVKVSKLKKYYSKTISENSADAVIFTGGQLVSNTFSIYFDALFKAIKGMNIPVFFNAVGIGLLDNHSKRIYRKVFSYDNIKSITCRCQKQRFCNLLQLKETRVQETFDTALLCYKFIENMNNRENKIGLGIMFSSRFPVDEIEDFWIRIINSLERKHIKWEIFTTGSPKDYSLAKQIMQKTGSKGNRVFCRASDPVELISKIGSFDSIISFRLHSHIIAYSIGIPSVGIIWDEKITDFFYKIDRLNKVFKIDDDIDTIISAAVSKDFDFSKRSETISTVEHIFKYNVGTLFDENKNMEEL